MATEANNVTATVNPWDSFVQGIYCHLKGHDTWPQALRHYEHALAGDITLARDFISWIHRGLNVDLGLSFAELKDPSQASAYLAALKGGRIQPTSARTRGIELASVICMFAEKPLGHLWHSIRLLNDVARFGGTYEALEASARRLGPIHNALDASGIPEAGKIREKSASECAGWLSLNRIDFTDGVPVVVGANSGPLPPLVSQADVDVACWLANFEGRHPVVPRFSLEPAQEANARLDVKLFAPDWIAATPYGQTLFQADWLMKGLSMRDGIPSFTVPYVSAGSTNGWRQPAIVDALDKVGGTDILSDGTPALSGRLEIVVRGVSLSRSMRRRWFRVTHAQYQLVGIDVFVESSLRMGKGMGHHRRNDPTTNTGASAAFLTKYYDYIGDLYPAFARAKLILALFSLFSQARRDGVRIAQHERDRLQGVITTYREQARRLPQIEYSPKHFHREGCYCNGGVSGSANATVVHSQRAPIAAPPPQIHFLASASGFISPVPDGAAHRISTAGSGIAYGGGSGGHGFHSSVSEVWVMDANNNQGARTYYKRESDGGTQKVDPFTGKTVAQDSPWAHIYH